MSDSDKTLSNGTAFLREHLEMFEKSFDDGLDPDEPGGDKAHHFAKAFSNTDLSALPDEELSRSEVFDLVNIDKNSIDTVCAAILAWGGMRKANKN